MSVIVHIDGNRQSEIEEFPEGLTTVGQYADQLARENIGSSDVVDREFSFKVDGDVADRDRDLATIVDGALLELIEVTVLEETTPDAVVEVADTPSTIAEILEYVGDDAERAQAALDDELAKGDESRVTLVEKLQAIVNPGE